MRLNIVTERYDNVFFGFDDYCQVTNDSEELACF